MAGIEPLRFLETLWRYRLDYDRNTLDSPSYWRRIAAECGTAYSDKQICKLVEADIALWAHLDPNMLAWAHDLRKGGVRTAILSNMPSDHATYLRANAAWLNNFDHKVFSGEMGVVKPSPEIYLACLRGLGVRPEEALFIDDVAANVEGGRALGIESIRFESVTQLVTEVRRFELPALFVGTPPVH